MYPSVATLVTLLIVFMLTACSSKPTVTREFDTNGQPLKTTYSDVDASYAYYADTHARLAGEQKPLFEMKALPGQTIELKGVESLVVNAPDNGAQSLAPPARRPTWLEQVTGLASAVVPYAQIAGNVIMNQDNQETSRFISATNAERDTALFNAFGAATSNGVNAIRDLGIAQAGTPNTVTNTTITGSFNSADDYSQHNQDNDTDIGVDVSGAMLIDSDNNTVFSPPTTTINTDNSDDGDDCTNADCSRPLPPDGG